MKAIKEAGGRRRIPWYAIALIGGAMLGSILLLTLSKPSGPPPPPVVVFEKSYRMPAQPISLFARVVPPTAAWAWLWHLKEKVCGKVKAVSLNTDILALSSNPPLPSEVATFVAPGGLGEPGLQVWLLDAAELSSLRQQLKSNPGTVLVNSPRMTTGNGMTASLFVGQTISLEGSTNQIGVRATYLAYVHPDLVDLTATLGFVDTWTNPAGSLGLHTNLDVKARFQILKGKGLFLLQSSPGESNAAPIGVILSATF